MLPLAPLGYPVLVGEDAARTPFTIAFRIASALATPSNSPFPKSCSFCPIVLVTSTPPSAFGFNAATPFITPNPPWLSDVPVVFAIMMLLIIIGLLHRIQTESHDGG